MASIFGIGFNGFQQISANNYSNIIHIPTHCFDVVEHTAGDALDTQVQVNITESACTWDSVAVLKDNTIITSGFYQKKDQAVNSLCLNLNPTMQKILSVVNVNDAIGLLIENGDFFLFKKVNNDSTSNDSKHLLFELKESNVTMIQSTFDDNKILLLTKSGNILILKRENQAYQYNLSPAISLQHPVLDLSCGKDHCLALTLNGNVFSWGIGSRGQLGHGDMVTSINPKLVEALDGVKVKQVCCGGWHSIALAESNDLYTWGWNESGQTGLPAPKHVFSTSVKIQSSHLNQANKYQTNTTQCEESASIPISQTDSGVKELHSTHPRPTELERKPGYKGGTEAIAELPQTLAFAVDPDIEISRNIEPVGIVLIPQLLELEDYLHIEGEFVSITQVSCGSRHTAAVTCTGALVTWGWGKYGQVGHSCCGQRSIYEGMKSKHDIKYIEQQICKAHCPRSVTWFKENGFVVHQVVCGPWNTFVYAHVMK